MEPKKNRYLKTNKEMRYPKAAENDYFRILRAVARKLREITKTEMENIKGLVRNDETDRERVIRIVREAYRNSGTREEALEEIRRIFRQVDSATRKNLERAFEDCLKTGVFVAILGAMDDVETDWMHTQETLVTDIEESYLNQLDVMLGGAVLAGTSYDVLSKSIGNLYSKAEKRCKGISTNEISTLFYLATRMYQEKSGISVYEWRTKEDNRVRKTHAFNNRKLFYWNNDKVGEINGREVFPSPPYHPGQDWGCRCVAIPVIDTEEWNFSNVVPLGMIVLNGNRSV